MSKGEFAEELRRRGYDAATEKGMVMVTGGDKGMFLVLEQVAKECGYTGSYGWRKGNEMQGL